MSQLFAPELETPSAEHDVCKACKFYEPALNPFQQGVYVSGDGELCTGIPPAHERPEDGWIVVLGEPLDYFADNPEKQGTWSAKAVNRLFMALRDQLGGEEKRIWYHPLTKCRALVWQRELDEDGHRLPKEARLTVNQYKRCWNFILPEIQQLRPKAFIATSQQAAKLLLGKDGDSMDVMAGKCYRTNIQYGEESEEVPVYPVHPTEHVWQDRDKRFDRWVELLKSTFNRIDNPLTYAFTKKEGWMSFDPGVTLQQVKDWFEPVLKDKENPLSWDVETTSVKKIWDNDARVGVFSFSHAAQEQPLIVVNSDYKYAQMTYDRYAPEGAPSWRVSEKDIMAYLKQIMEDPTVRKLGHNTMYDETSVYSRFGWEVKGFFADTLILAYILNSDQAGGRTLNELVRKYLPGVPEYWKIVEKFTIDNPSLGYNYVDYPPDVMLPYAAYDTKTVRHIFELMLNEFSEKVNSGWGGWFVRSTEPVATPTYNVFDYAFRARRVHYLLCGHLERTGQAVDKSLVDKVTRSYEEDKERMETELAAYPEIEKFEWTALHFCYKENSAERRRMEKLRRRARVALAKERGIELAPKELKDFLALKNDLLPEISWETDKELLMSQEFKTLRPRMNWGSPNHVKALFYKFMGLDVPHYTDTDEPSTDRAALVMLHTRQNCEIAGKLLELRGVQKFLSSFVHPMNATDKEDRTIKDDGLVHSQFSPNSTRTGRLSSRAPNMQQVPRDGLVKKLYNSRYPHGWVMQRDYSGLEVRVLACVSQDPKLVDDFLNGRDPHFRTQKYFFGEMADAHNKTQRSICKQVLFGRVYGQGSHGLYELLKARQVPSPYTGEDITVEECEKLNTMIDELYPGVAAWVDWAHAQAAQEAWVCSPFGFVRPLPAMESFERYLQGKRERDESKSFKLLASEINGCLRRAQNSPIQSAASDLTVFAGWRCVQELKAAGLESQVFLLVHDSVWVDVVDHEEVEPVSRILHDVMDNVPDWIGELLPGYDPSWMNIPIIGEMEMGTNAKDALVASTEPSKKTDKPLIFDVPKDWMTESLTDELVDSEAEDEKIIHVPFRQNHEVIRKMLLAKRKAI